MSNLLAVLQHYGIPYENKIICPFHADKNPSMTIDVNKDEWHCFGCSEGGDAYKFHKKMQFNSGNKNEINILKSYNKILKGNTKSSLDVKFEASSNISKDKKYFRQCLIEAKDYYYGLKYTNWLKTENESIEYLKWRGFTKSMLNRFGVKLTYKDGYSMVFPILDNGHFKGYMKATCDPWLRSQKKYLYNTGFRRATTLDGTYNKGKVVLLTEGHIDMLAAKNLGFKNSAALLGWKASEKQIQKLKDEGVEIVISALDNDECGIKGTKYLKQHFKVIRFEYPDGIKDMGDMLKERKKNEFKMQMRSLLK